MFDNPFLEGAASSRNKRQQLDHLLRITAPHERIILAGIGVVLLALMAWALFGSIVRSVTIDGVLIEPGLRHEVVSTEPGYLVEFLVVPGDRVEAGDPIARQSVPELVRETAALRDRVEMLETATATFAVPRRSSAQRGEAPTEDQNAARPRSIVYSPETTYPLDTRETSTF